MGNTPPGKHSVGDGHATDENRSMKPQPEFEKIRLGEMNIA